MDEFDRIDFEAHVGLPITDEQFEAFKLLYHSGCFTDWADFAKKAQPIVDWLYLPVTDCCLGEEKYYWETIYKYHPSRRVREDALQIYTFLDTLEMWHTPKRVIFRNECVNDYMLETLQGIDGVCILQQDECSIVELDIAALVAFCKAQSDMVYYATGRTWKEEVENVPSSANKSIEVG